MQLKIYNTLTKKKDLFKPLKSGKVNIFVCGPTVYDYSHIGHAKNYITFDAFVKYLRKLGYKVFYLQNITDLDDKIIARAREKQVSPKDLAVAFEKEYLKDIKKLGIDSVTKYARATNYIKEIISQVKRLMDKDYAYEIENDGIYYNINKFKKYGKLAGRTVLQAEDGVSRIDYSKNKKNRGDFCLWKFSVEGEPSWSSPWGKGRPGWHIEDTAITEKFFGAQYDIHGGAIDLIFPHHEAEICQMESISGKSPLVKYWMHVGFLTVGGQKMSKSLGNFITINDLLSRCPANYFRFLVLKNLWHSPLDYTESIMIEVKSTIEKMEDFLKKLKIVKAKKSSREVKASVKKLKENFYSELSDDFNTPKAFAVLFEFMKQINIFLEQGLVSKKDAFAVYKFFEEINDIFGILDFKKLNRPVPAAIKKIVLAREKYRQDKEWQKADEVRDELENKGYTVEDTNDGPVVKSI